VPAGVQEEASALRAAALSAAEPVYVAEGIVGAPPQVELWRPQPHALGQPDQPAPLPALEAPSGDGHTAEQATAPALPATPRPCLLLALQRAVAGRDEATVAAVVQAAATPPAGTPRPSWPAAAPSAVGDASQASCGS
jgi:hypothetical protein